MKHIFLINPAAGRGAAETEALPRILQAVHRADVDYEIHRTMHVGDASHFARNRCLEHPTEDLRFYAVGGDGTLNETANGIVGFPRAELAFFPAGTGNDFARMFSDPKAFRDPERQLRGRAKAIDLLRYNGRYCVNMLNIGLDCEVVDEVDSLKKITPLRGPLAYLAGIAVVFIGNEGFRLSVSVDEEVAEEGEFTLVAIGNGAFCGGGFKGAPRARIEDGLLDVGLVRKVSRRAFVALLPHYKKGTHLDQRAAKGVIEYRQCRSVVVRPLGKDQLKVCADGEIEFAQEVRVEVEPGAVRFSLPEGCE